MKLTKIEREILVDLVNDTMLRDKGYRRAGHLENGCEYFNKDITLAPEFKDILDTEDHDDNPEEDPKLHTNDVLERVINKLIGLEEEKLEFVHSTRNTQVKLDTTKCLDTCWEYCSYKMERY